MLFLTFSFPLLESVYSSRIFLIFLSSVVNCLKIEQIKLRKEQTQAWNKEVNEEC